MAAEVGVGGTEGVQVAGVAEAVAGLAAGGALRVWWTRRITQPVARASARRPARRLAIFGGGVRECGAGG